MPGVPKTVWKFNLFLGDQSVPMPNGALALALMYQGDQLCLWALVDPEATAVHRRIMICGTGHPLTNADMYTYIGSVVQGPFVWHAFDGGDGEEE